MLVKIKRLPLLGNHEGTVGRMVHPFYLSSSWFPNTFLDRKWSENSSFFFHWKIGVRDGAGENIFFFPCRKYRLFL